MHIREANPSDIEPMARMMVDSFLAAHRGQIPDEVWEWRQKYWTPEVSAHGWERIMRDIANGTTPYACVYVAEGEDAEILGLAMGTPAGGQHNTGGTGEICALYVHPDHQRHGIGHQLVASTAAHLAHKGMTKLQIGALKANLPACKFYEALGGQPVAEREVEDAGFLLPEVVYGWSDIATLLASGSSQRQTGEP